MGCLHLPLRLRLLESSGESLISAEKPDTVGYEKHFWTTHPLDESKLIPSLIIEVDMHPRLALFPRIRIAVTDTGVIASVERHPT